MTSGGPERRVLPSRMTVTTWATEHNIHVVLGEQHSEPALGGQAPNECHRVPGFLG